VRSGALVGSPPAPPPARPASHLGRCRPPVGHLGQLAAVGGRVLGRVRRLPARPPRPPRAAGRRRHHERAAGGALRRAPPAGCPGAAAAGAGAALTAVAQPALCR
jgi:hypothetical protein